MILLFTTSRALNSVFPDLQSVSLFPFASKSPKSFSSPHAKILLVKADILRVKHFRMLDNFYGYPSQKDGFKP